jgi:hypothetical protein
MASPDNRDLGAGVVWMRRPGYRKYTHWKASYWRLFPRKRGMALLVHLLCQSRNSQGARRVLHHNASNGLWCHLPQTFETPRSPSGQASGKVDTRHATLDARTVPRHPHARLGQSLAGAISGKADECVQHRLRSIAISGYRLRECQRLSNWTAVREVDEPSISLVSVYR